MNIIDWLLIVAKGSISMTSFLILSVIGVIFVIVLIFSNNDKLHTIVFLSIIGFYIFAKFCCAPNFFEVHTMLPMAKKVTSYIEKNTIPNSIKDIPDLPYELTGCKKDITYGDAGDRPRNYLTENSQWEEKVETCHFKNMVLRLTLVRALKPQKSKWTGDVRIDSDGDITLSSLISEHDNGKFISEKLYFTGSNKGICNPLRQ